MDLGAEVVRFAVALARVDPQLWYRFSRQVLYGIHFRDSFLMHNISNMTICFYGKANPVVRLFDI